MSEKITISTDWHFGKSNGKFDHIILKGIFDQCDHAEKNGIKIMFNLGDTLDVKQTITTSTMNFLAKAFKRVNETFDMVYVLAGNHDMSKKTYNAEGHNLTIFDGYSNVTIIDEPKVIDVFEKEFYMLPYFPNEMLKDHQFQDADFMMGHIEVQGFMLNQFIKAQDGLNANAITKKYDHVFLGHFHKRQTRGKISYIGNMVRFFYGEDDDERGWTVLDPSTGKQEFVEYDHPRMYKFKLSLLMEEEDLSDVFNEGDNLKLVIDKQLKYTEMEEFKSKLILDYKINDLVLDDQFYAFDIEELDDETDEENDEETDLDPTYMDYLLVEMGKMQNIDISEKAMAYLKEKSKEYQE